MCIATSVCCIVKNMEIAECRYHMTETNRFKGNQEFSFAAIRGIKITVRNSGPTLGISFLVWVRVCDGL